MKKQVSILMAVLLLVGVLTGCGRGEKAAAPDASPADSAALVAHIPTTQHFTDEAVAQADVDAILLAGVNSPSAMNGQPWHFSAITDKAVMEEIAGAMSFGGPGGGKGPVPPDGNAPAAPPDGNAPAMPDGKGPAEGDRPAPPAGGGKKSGVGDTPLAIVVSCKEGSAFDAGLACQNMSVEAALLGYGTKIVSSPTIALNGEKQAHFREVLGIPADQTAVAVLLVGKADPGADATTSATQRNPLADMVSYVK